MSDVRWVEPSTERRARIDRWFARLRHPARGALWPLVGVEVHGAEHVPRTGACLVLANHATLLDPITLMLAAGRPIQWMGTETLLRRPVVGPIQRWLGTVPKKRFQTDVRAVWLLREWAKSGGLVGLFPEGERTWTGLLQPFLPGLAGLIRMLDAPVVLAQLHNHYLQWPRWTGRARRGRVAVTFAPPKKWPRKSDPDEVVAWVRAGLTVDPRSRPDLAVRTRNRAVGLANVVFLCPTCGDEGLAEARNRLVCSTCSAVWGVDPLHRLTSGGRTVLLEDHMDHQRDDLAARWAHHDGGAVFSCEGVELVDHTAAPAPVATGTLTLWPDRVEIGRWHVPLTEIVEINVEFERMLELRTHDRYLKALVPHGSAWKWPWAVRWWQVSHAG